MLGRAALSALGMAVQGLGRFAYTWAVGRFLGPETLGDVSALLSLSVYAALFWPAGLAITASWSLATPDLAARSVRYLRRSFWTSSAVLTPLFGVLAWILTKDATAAVATAVLVLAYSGYTFTRGVLVGRDRLGKAVIWDSVASIVTLAALVGMLVGRWHWAVLLPLTAGYAVFTLAAWPREPGLPSPEADPRWRTYARAAAVGAVATGGLLPATMVFVRAFDAPAAGYFGAALALATPLNMLSQALNQVLIPHFSRLLVSSPQSVPHRHKRLVIATSAAFVAAFGLLVLVAPWLITFVFGDRYAPGTLTMQALLVVVAVISCSTAPAALLMATERQRTYATIWVAASVTGTAIMAAASPAWGQWGAILGFGVGAVGGSLAVIIAAFQGKAHHQLQEERPRRLG